MAPLSTPRVLIPETDAPPPEATATIEAPVVEAPAEAAPEEPAGAPGATPETAPATEEEAPVQVGAREKTHAEIHGPSHLDIAKAAFQRENTLVSGITRIYETAAMTHDVDPDFVISDRVKGTILELEEFSRFQYGVENEHDFAIVEARLMREYNQTQTLANAGWEGFALQLAAGFADPVNFIPVGGVAIRGARLGKTVLGGAKTAVRAGVLSTAVSEGVLHVSQDTRTGKESVMNLGGAVILGGILGGSAAGIGRFYRVRKGTDTPVYDPGGTVGREATDAEVTKMIGDDIVASMDTSRHMGGLDDEIELTSNSYYEAEDVLDLTPIDDSLGTIKHEDVITGELIESPMTPALAELEPSLGMAKLGAMLNVSPMLRIFALRRNPWARRLAGSMFEMSAKFSDEVLAPGGAMQTRAKNQQWTLIETRKARVSSFADYKTRLGKEGQPPDGRLSEREFGEDIFIAIDNGNVVPDWRGPRSQAAKAEIEQAAKVYTDLGYAPYTKRLEGVERIQKGWTKDHSEAYAPHMWDRHEVEHGVLPDGRKFDDVAAEEIRRDIAGDVAKYNEENAVHKSQLRHDQGELNKSKTELRKAQNEHKRNNAAAEKLGRTDTPEKLTAQEARTRAERDALRKAHQEDSRALSRAMAKKTNKPTPEELATLRARAGASKKAWQKKRAENTRDKTRLEKRARLKEEAEIKAAQAKSAENVKTLKAKVREQEGGITATRNKFNKAHEDTFKTMPNEDGIKIRVGQMKDHILGESPERIPSSRIANAGPHTNHMGTRTVRWGMEQKSPWLIKDPDVVLESQHRTMAFDIELLEKFGSTKPEDWAMWKYMTDWYDEAAAAAPNVKARKRIMKDKENEIYDITGMLAMARGRGGLASNGRWERALKVVRQFKSATSMGRIVFSSISDPARITMTQGVVRTFGGTVKVLAGGMKHIEGDVKMVSLAVDKTLMERMAAMMDVGTDFGQNAGKFSQAGDWMATTSMKYFGGNHWNAGVKTLTGNVLQPRFIKNVRSWGRGTLSRSELRYMKGLNINEKMLDLMAEQVSIHSPKKTFWDVGRVDLWAESGPKGIEAQVAWNAGMRKAVDTIIVTPTVGDLPLAISYGPKSAELKTIFLFKSFLLASHARVIVPMAQSFAMVGRGGAGDAAAHLFGVANAVGLGMLGYALAELAAGREVEWGNLPKLVAEGVDRSGAIPYLMQEPMNMLDRIFPVYENVLGISSNSRYANRNMASTLMGPASGTFFSDIPRLGGATVRGVMGEKPTREEFRLVRRNIPFNQTFYLQNGVNFLEEQAADALGLRSSKSRGKASL